MKYDKKYIYIPEIKLNTVFSFTRYFGHCLFLSVSLENQFFNMMLFVIRKRNPQPATFIENHFSFFRQRKRLPQNRDSLFQYNQVLKISLPT